jgi:hypothetical protein
VIKSIVSTDAVNVRDNLVDVSGEGGDICNVPGLMNTIVNHYATVIFISYPRLLIHMPRIEGQTVDNHNQPVENATITIPSAGLFALSDEHGRFEIDNIPPGIHTLYVVHRNFQKFGADLRLVEDMVVTLELDRQM